MKPIDEDGTMSMQSYTSLQKPDERPPALGVALRQFILSVLRPIGRHIASRGSERLVLGHPDSMEERGA